MIQKMDLNGRKDLGIYGTPDIICKEMGKDNLGPWKKDRKLQKSRKGQLCHESCKFIHSLCDSEVMEVFMRDSYRQNMSLGAH